MLEVLKPWLTPDGILLVLTLLTLGVSVVKGRASAQKFKNTSALLQTVIQGVEEYRNANPAEKAKIRDTIQGLADEAGVEEDLNKVVKEVTK